MKEKYFRSSFFHRRIRLTDLQFLIKFFLPTPAYHPTAVTDCNFTSHVYLPWKTPYYSRVFAIAVFNFSFSLWLPVCASVSANMCQLRRQVCECALYVTRILLFPSSLGGGATIVTIFQTHLQYCLQAIPKSGLNISFNVYLCSLPPPSYFIRFVCFNPPPPTMPPYISLSAFSR